MKKIILFLFCAFFICSALLAQERQQNQITVPTPESPTVSIDVAYALGQQSVQLTTISGRLEKLEDKLEDFHEDIVRMNTVGLFLVLLMTAIVGPIIVEWVRQRLSRRNAHGR